ncbi:MAG: hypothetical protein P8O03_15635, partial [Ilumatobacter sp.]|nr:hypothetical protein [Ilumatobacter sp.]
MTDTTASSAPNDDEAAAFRKRCIDFMKSRPKQHGAPTADQSRQFHADAKAAGVGAGVPYPAEYGGGGLTLAHDKIWREVKNSFPVMEADFVISHGMCLPMVN